MDGAYFSTFTLNNWVSLFIDFPESNHIICNSFNDMVKTEECTIYSFVIMRDHIHLLWKIKDQDTSTLRTRFTKFTGKEIAKYLRATNEEYLDNFQSERSDRKHKIWKQSKSDLLIVHNDIYQQKLNYIHDNPTKGEYKTVKAPEDHAYSSAVSYHTGERNFKFLTIRRALSPPRG